MDNRSYNQFCALASALDVVGERWTLLIIRELLSGPRRFKDLIDGLPGISSNLLSDRLKNLEQQGITRRRVLPPPAGSSVYELTPFGMDLERAILELGRWGSRLLPRSPDCAAQPSIGTTALSIKAFFRPEQAHEMDETYELHLGNEVLQIYVSQGELKVFQGRTRKPDAVFYTDMQSWMALFAGQMKSDEAISQGRLRIEGDPTALKRLLQLSSVAESM